MDHGGERRNRNHIARRLDGAFLGVLLDQLEALGIGCRLDVAQLLQDPERIVFEEGRELRVTLPGALDGRLEHATSLARQGRYERTRLLQLDVALARLLRVVE